jgi:hypothetical protein
MMSRKLPLPCYFALPIDEIMGSVPSLTAAACSPHPQAAFNRIIAY